MSGVAPLAANQLLNEESPEKLNRSSISEESPISSENGGSPAKKKGKHILMVTNHILMVTNANIFRKFVVAITWSAAIKTVTITIVLS